MDYLVGQEQETAPVKIVDDVFKNTMEKEKVDEEVSNFLKDLEKGKNKVEKSVKMDSLVMNYTVDDQEIALVKNVF